MRRLFFRKSQRLLTKQDFSRVFDQCTARVGRGPVLLLAVPNDLGYPRLGLVVRKKFIPSAVARNQFKRSTRECFRLMQHELPAQDIVVLNRAGSDTLGSQHTQTLLNKAFHALIRQVNSAE